MCCNLFLSAGVQLLRSICISSSVLIMLKPVSELVQLSSDVVIGEATVAITILDSKSILWNKLYKINIYV